MLVQPKFQFDFERSARLAKRVRAQQRRCWRNAALAVSHLGPAARYVEGWVVTTGTVPHVIEHGWCELDGQIIDPTYVPEVNSEAPPAAYFVGARFTPQQAERALSERLPITYEREPESHWRAFEAAWRAATARAGLEPRPPARVVHCRQEPFDVYIGRPTHWANPFQIGLHGSRMDVLRRYCKAVVRHPGLLRMIWGLRGKVLGCRCHPLPCHGEILAELANVEHVPPGQLLGRWLSATKAAPEPPRLQMPQPRQPLVRAQR